MIKILRLESDTLSVYQLYIGNQQQKSKMRPTDAKLMIADKVSDSKEENLYQQIIVDDSGDKIFDSKRFSADKWTIPSVSDCQNEIPVYNLLT